MSWSVSCASSLFSLITAFHIVDPLYRIEYFMCEIFVVSDHCLNSIPWNLYVCSGVFDVRDVCSPL